MSYPIGALQFQTFHLSTQATAARYEVDAVPMFAFFRKGRLLHQVGMHTIVYSYHAFIPITQILDFD